MLGDANLEVLDHCMLMTLLLYKNVHYVIFFPGACATDYWPATPTFPFLLGPKVYIICEDTNITKSLSRS